MTSDMGENGSADDRNLLVIPPDHEVSINVALLEEIDGPMLKHGLQEMHQRRITLPSRVQDRPDPDRLDQRYQRFLTA